MSAYVLIVEDTEDIATLVRLSLEQLGLVSHHCKNAQSALDFLETNDPPMLIVLDIGMPGMNGWEFLEIVKMKPYFNSFKVVVCTAFSDPANRVVGKLQEVDGYVTKPFGPAQIKNVVANLLEL